ncbi:hypothetical protein KKC59_04020, partial [bacterium]|nr:hypothetical protein [bacterium]
MKSLVKDIVRKDIEKDRLAHSYILVSSLENGFLEALNVAKILNCDSFFEKDHHNCSVCRRIDEKKYPDLVVVAAKGKGNFITISDIKDVQDIVSVTPYEGKKRVCVFTDAGKMDTEASNSFLKTLEEPPSDTVFILIVSNLRNVMDSIVSRCRRIFIESSFDCLKEFEGDDNFLKIRNIIIDEIITGSRSEKSVTELIDNIHETIKKKYSGIKEIS